MNTQVTLEKLSSLAKRRGFFYPTADIYGGLNGVFDKGHLGSLLEERIILLWKKHMKSSSYSILQFNGSILGPEIMWKASGHVDGFNDPLVDCKSCKSRFRDDEIDLNKNCPRCGNKEWSEIRQFNMMFSTQLGASSDTSTTNYLRPETAQTIFVQFKNIMSSFRVKIPFGVMQIGKSFRNEITPRQLLFRMREFSQMEMEFFCHPKDGSSFFEYWIKHRCSFYKSIGIKENSIKLRHHETFELSHYSKGTSDVEFYFPFGWKELEGIAYRTDFDLKEHTTFSKKDLMVFDEEKKESYFPHVVECSVGLERLFFAILSDAYSEEEVNGDSRIILKLDKSVAPIYLSILPLTKNEALLGREIYNKIKESIDREIIYDDSGSIGKRYRRYDEIGVPFCITIDSQSLLDNMVTIRDRDSMEQKRIFTLDILNEIK